MPTPIEVQEMNSRLVNLIVDRLSEYESLLKIQFVQSIKEVGVRYCFMDDLLPLDIATNIYKAFPGLEGMRLLKSFREQKYTSKNVDKFNPLMRGITFAFQDPQVVAIVERITGIEKQVPDERLYAGGLSAMSKGQFLGPHIDNSHDGDRKNYRTLNLLYYISPDWRLENGGNLELWDSKVRRCVTIESKFNRLVIMETNPRSWHSVSEVTHDRLRCCVSNYYFSSRSPTGGDYFNITSFSARPDQYFLRGWTWVDNMMRRAVRLMVPDGLAKRDFYEGPKG
jgi:Rps23 Pro-64 3,4-dihydroxylase Tpa1-like proline 4-hydroxylase